MNKKQFESLSQDLKEIKVKLFDHDQRFEKMDKRMDGLDYNQDKLVCEYVNFSARVNQFIEQNKDVPKRLDELNSNVLHMNNRIDTLFQEKVCNDAQYKRHDKWLDNHEERIEELEIAN